ncbi:MAG: peptidoglycan-binding domain-containing protein [Pseudomonadota bacterium]
MVRFTMAVLAAAMLSSGAPAAAQQGVCVEEVAGVCLKFETVEPSARSQPRPAPSQAQTAEQALQLSRAERRDVQRGLRAEGFYRSSIDGLFGRGTRGAISAWQRANGLSATGFLSADQARRLRRLGQSQSAGTSSTEPRVAAPAATARDLGELIGGLGCNSEVHGETTRIVFRRDGGAAAAAVDVSLFVTWTFKNRRFCIFNRGNEINCFPLEIAITSANRDQVRERVSANCMPR